MIAATSTTQFKPQSSKLNKQDLDRFREYAQWHNLNKGKYGAHIAEFVQRDPVLKQFYLDQHGIAQLHEEKADFLTQLFDSSPLDIFEEMLIKAIYV